MAIVNAARHDTVSMLCEVKLPKAYHKKLHYGWRFYSTPKIFSCIDPTWRLSHHFSKYVWNNRRYYIKRSLINCGAGRITTGGITLWYLWLLCLNVRTCLAVVPYGNGGIALHGFALQVVERLCSTIFPPCYLNIFCYCPQEDMIIPVLSGNYTVFFWCWPIVIWWCTIPPTETNLWTALDGCFG